MPPGGYQWWLSRRLIRSARCCSSTITPATLTECLLLVRSMAIKRAGYPPKMLQEIMVHASITTTLDLYGHLYPGDMDRYADRLDDAADEAGKAKTRPDDDEDNTDA